MTPSTTVVLLAVLPDRPASTEVYLRVVQVVAVSKKLSFLQPANLASAPRAAPEPVDLQKTVAPAIGISCVVAVDVASALSV